MNIKNKLKTFACGSAFMLFASPAFADSGWTVDVNAYQYDMTLYAALDEVADLSKYELAAFVGDECRGVAELQSKEVGGKTYYWYYLRVRSNSASGEKITLKAYDKENDKTIRIAESYDFASQGAIGLPSNAETLTQVKYTLGDVNDDGRINVTDVIAVRRLIAGITNPSFIREAADVNGDGRVNITDVISIRRIIANK